MGRRQWGESEDFSIPQTPLIDIIFILIVFFLVATTFYTEERDIEVNLPEGTEGTGIDQDEGRFIVNVRASGVIVVNGDVLSMEELERVLEARAETRRKDVEIRGDQETPHGKIMTVMNLCKKHGLSQLAITQRIVKERP